MKPLLVATLTEALVEVANYFATAGHPTAVRTLYQNFPCECQVSALVGGLMGGIEKAPQFSAEELRKLRALLDSL